MTKLSIDLSDLLMTGAQRQILAPYFASSVANKDGWIKLHCPIHGDSNPSAGINVNTSWWRCQACGEGGSVHTLLARQHEWKPPDYDRIIGEDPGWEPSTASRPLPSEGLPRVKDLEELTSRLLTKYRDPLEYLEIERGIEPRTIEQFKVGYRLREHGGEYTLPMMHDGKVVNVRYYNPTREPKILNHPGHGTIGLFPDNDIPAHSKLVIVEGGWDCLATMQHLERYGYIVRTFTNGTGAVMKLSRNDPVIQRILASEPAEVITIFDCDKPGRKAAAHLVKLLEATEVVLPYRITDDGGKDLTDYWQERKGQSDEAERQLLDLIHGEPNTRSRPLREASPRRPGKRRGTGTSTPTRPARRAGRVVPGTGDRPAETPLCGSLHSALTDPRYDDQLLRLTEIEVLAFVGSVLKLPRTGKVVGCKRPPTNPDQCDYCPRLNAAKEKKWSLSIFDDAHVQIFSECFGQGRAHRLAEISQEHNDLCNYAKSELLTGISYQWAVVRQRGSNKIYPACVAYERDDLQIKQLGVYEVTARVLSSAKDEEQILLIVDAKNTAKEAISTPDRYAAPPEGYGSGELLQWIYDLADLVALKHTRVFGQPLLHVVMCMFFTSPQYIVAGEQKRESGRADLAIVGATRTGKTTAISGIARAFGHDGLDLEDSMVSAENASLAGLTATTEKAPSGQWYSKPGVFPRNDGGYVILDELQQLASSRNNDGRSVTMGDLNTIRSSGYVAVKKPGDARFDAAVRFVAIMNPPPQMKDRFIEAILESYNEEQVRSRTDLVVSVSKIGQLEQQQIEEDLTSGERPSVAEMQLAWKAQVARELPPERIVFPKGGEFVRALDDYCEEYAALYSPEHDHIGVMHPQTNRLTLLKYAAAIAILAMSFTDEYQKVLVTKVHLDTAKQIIDAVNEEPGYASLMRERRAERLNLQTSIRAAVRKLVNNKGATESQRRAIKAFIGNWNEVSFRIDPHELHWGAWKSIEDELTILIQQGLLEKEKNGKGRFLVMAPEFRRAIGEALRQRSGDE